MSILEKSGKRKKTGGRAKGVPNKKTALLKKAVEEGGLTPLDVMLNNMRWAMDQVGTLGVDNIDGIAMRKVAQDAAKDAAPYLHPRLTSTELKVDDRRSMTDDERARRIDELAAALDGDRISGTAGIGEGGGSQSKPH